MTGSPGFYGWQFLLLLLSCMGSGKSWHTCIGGHSLSEDHFTRNEILRPVSPMEFHKSVFGKVESKDNCAHVANAWGSRSHSVSITDFGAVGDGKTLNTHAFENALFHLRNYAANGGAQLYIPAGLWLTGSITLISHITLFLENGATILGSEDFSDYPIIPGLPSYGRGRELPGPRFSSLINGNDLEDVIITGDNATIDGQGAVWWNAFRNKTLNYTRGHMLELIASKNIFISNLTFKNSPFWTIHPVYCKNVVVKNLTILNPFDAPNTDGIDPDSSQHVCIEDCYISVGDDAISIKSGWDQFGTSFGMPSKHIKIHRIVAFSRSSAGISFGSEMSGGISNVKVDGLVVTGARWGVRIKTAVGRGGYVKDISVNNIVLHSVRTALAVMGNYGEHPDENWNRTAYPLIEDIRMKNIVGQNITQAGLFLGLQESPFRNIHLFNVSLEVNTTKVIWNCSDVTGSYHLVLPIPCIQFTKDSV